MVFSCAATRFSAAIFVIFSIANQVHLARAIISNEHHNIQSPLDSIETADPNQDIRKILDDAFSQDDDDPDINIMPNPGAAQPKEKTPGKAPPVMETETRQTRPKNRTSEELFDVGDKRTTIDPDDIAPVAKKRSSRNFDFDITPGVLLALASLMLSLYILQWLVSVMMPIKTPNPVPWLRDTASDVARGGIPGILASSARASRDGQLKLWVNSLSTLMVQTFVIGPFALLAMAVGHYADSDEGFDENVATFLVVFGACTGISLVFFFFVAATMLCVSCSKIATWQRNEMLSGTPDDVVRGYTYAMCEQQVNPPRCDEVCKKEDIQAAVDKMHYLVLRTQVVPFRELEPELRDNAWSRPFFPRKHEVKDRVAHFDLAQYLTVKLAFVISEIFFVRHWMWLITGPIVLGAVALQWFLNESKLSAQAQIGIEYLEFFIYSLILVFAVLIIHLKLKCLKRRRFAHGLQEVDDKIKELVSSGENEDNEEVLDWMATGKDIMTTFIHASQAADAMPEAREEKVWFGEPGRVCGHNWLKHLLQLTLVFSSALMSIFFWHIVPLVWVKLGPVIAAVVIAIMLSAWLGLVIWVPNVVINLVLLGHCGSRSFDPTVIAKIQSEGRSRLEAGAETIFDCVLLHELSANKSGAAIKKQPDAQLLQTQAAQLFECLSLDGTVDTKTLARWFNVNMVRAPVTFSLDFITDKLGLDSDSLLDEQQFSDIYAKIIQMRRTLQIDFTAFQEATKTTFLSDKERSVGAQGFYELMNRYMRVAEGCTHLTTLQRVANENAFLAVAEIFDVADVNSFGECDVELLIVVIKMYLPDW